MGRSNLILRIILGILLFWGVFAMPFWAVVILALFGLIYFKNFYEFIAVFMLHDFLYATAEPHMWGSVFTLTLGSIIVYLLAFFIKNKIIFSKLRNYVS